MTVALAAEAVRNGSLVALRWRAPWLSVPWGIIRSRRRPLSEPEQAFLDLLRTADHEAETLARRLLADHGVEWGMEERSALV